MGAFTGGVQLFGEVPIFQQPLLPFLYATVSCIFWGYLLGLAAGSRSNYPMAFCEAGISLGRTFVYWSEVPLAKWESDCANVLSLSLNRDLGRIYLQVPSEDRVAIEEFVRTKTKFKD